MGTVLGGMTVSLDGFVNDRTGGVSRLYPDLEALRQTPLRQEAMQTVGAVVMGDQSLSRPLAHLIGEAVDISELRPALDASPDRAMDILLEFCAHHVGDRAATHRDPR